jgi:hypothetical protein
MVRIKEVDNPRYCQNMDLKSGHRPKARQNNEAVLLQSAVSSIVVLPNIFVYRMHRFLPRNDLPLCPESSS